MKRNELSSTCQNIISLDVHFNSSSSYARTDTKEPKRNFLSRFIRTQRAVGVTFFGSTQNSDPPFDLSGKIISMLPARYSRASTGINKLLEVVATKIKFRREKDRVHTNAVDVMDLFALFKSSIWGTKLRKHSEKTKQS
ncbi:hypothetical protein LguiB_028754 [Lonicera macranthoides]